MAGASPVLEEIAALLRRRVELAERALQYQQERDRRQEEKSGRLAERLKADLPRFELPEMPAFDARGHDEQMRRIEEQAEQARQEQRHFQERVVAELERHNNVLERIISRLEKDA